MRPRAILAIVACSLASAPLAPYSAAAAASRLVAAPSHEVGPVFSWAQPQIEAVVAAGLMGPSVADFRPDDPLSWTDFGVALGALGFRPPAVADPSRAVRLRELDAQLVRSLGLARAAKSIQRTLAVAGLRPPSRVGAEAIARLLGLRYNHPERDEVRELEPGAPVTRADAAYSLAKVIQLRGGDVSSVVGLVSSLQIDELSDWQRAVLTTAVRFVGYPYVWGGSTEDPQAPFGVTVPGGFDCSGFVWRVFTGESYSGAEQLASVLVGRTTYELSSEFDPAARLSLGELEPGDVVFFGDRGLESTSAEIGHMGILLSPGWMVHSSNSGTTITPLSLWYAERFAWGRRPLAEAGLA